MSCVGFDDKISYFCVVVLSGVLHVITCHQMSHVTCFTTPTPGSNQIQHTHLNISKSEHGNFRNQEIIFDIVCFVLG